MNETPETPWHDQIAIPALLRHARSTYGRAMRRSLAEAGYDDIPANGLYIIGGLALGDGGVPIGQLVRELGVTKQAAGQLVDALVLRGYVSVRSSTRNRQRCEAADRRETPRPPASVPAVARRTMPWKRRSASGSRSAIGTSRCCSPRGRPAPRPAARVGRSGRDRRIRKPSTVENAYPAERSFPPFNFVEVPEPSSP